MLLLILLCCCCCYCVAIVTVVVVVVVVIVPYCTAVVACRSIFMPSIFSVCLELSRARQLAFDTFRKNNADSGTIEQHKKTLKLK